MCNLFYVCNNLFWWWWWCFVCVVFFIGPPPPPLLVLQGLIGALDMGGASTEISFAASAKDNQSHYVRELLMGKKEDLYARSYLCYGYNEALSRFLAHLYSENVSVVGHVCAMGGTCDYSGTSPIRNVWGHWLNTEVSLVLMSNRCPLYYGCPD